MNSPQRKRDGQERRRELCDAAILVLAEHGSRGLTHKQVDETAGVPDGTTSYYYRTRAALLRGVGERMSQIDIDNLRSVTDEATKSDSPFGRLAQLVMMQAEGRGLMLNRARHELALAAARDPELAEKTQKVVSRITAMANEAIAQLQPPSDDRALLAAQTNAVLTYISGVFTRFAMGDRTVDDAEQLERMLQAIVTAVSLDQAPVGVHSGDRPR
jgi:DNA-binding transcriptional regulator YbjK